MKIYRNPQRVRPAFIRASAGLKAGVILFVLVAIVAFVAPMINLDAANRLGTDIRLSPSVQHLLGTDSFGRDMLMRALVATRLSIIMTAAATAVSVILGVLIGTGIRLAPPRIRRLSLRAVEIAVSYPSLLVAVVIAAIVGTGPWQLVVAIGLAGVPAMARLSSTLAAAVYEKDFVTTSLFLGVPRRVIAVRHLLPNMAETLLVQTATVFSFGLIAISALSFVGLGVQTPQYDLGRLLADGLPAIYVRPLEIVGPTMMILLVSVAAILIGDGLAARANPMVRSAAGKLGARTLKRSKGGSPASAAMRGGTDHQDNDVRGATDGTFAHDDPPPDRRNLVLDVSELEIFRPDGTRLVHGVDLSIAQGEILGLVGESGSGKSLTAMAIAQLLADGLTMQASRMVVAGQSYDAPVSRKDLATRVGVVFQDPGSTFIPVLKMGAQLTEVLRQHRGMSRREARNKVAALLAKVRIQDPRRLLASRPFELSGGMRQRAMIAAALANESPLIVADEPTTALDVTVQAGILAEFKEINRRDGIAILFISHDITVVEELCDRVLVMKNGEFVEELSAEELRRGDAKHPYTQHLLSVVPRVEWAGPVEEHRS